MKTAAVVVNWNSGAGLEKCLKSLAGSDGLDEIVVVDNASQDDSVARASRDCTAVQFINNSENRGFAGGVNQGVSVTHARFVLILNPDVEAEQGAISQLLDLMESRPRAGAVGGNVNSRYLPRRLATPWSLTLENLGLNRHAMTPSDTEVEQAAAAAILIRREAFDEVGGFDEGFHPAWYEDVDFCKRLHAADWSVHFVESARFRHEGGYSAKALGRTAFLSAFYRNQVRYAGKHFGSAGAVLVRVSIVAGMLGRMIADPPHMNTYAKVMIGAAGAW